MPYKDRQKHLEYHRAYWAKNGDKTKDRKLKKEFGITLAQYTELLEKQHGVCASCFRPEKTVHNLSKKVQRLSVDHDHVTGAVRGLLCSNCNTALGLLGESPERAQALIAYMERFRG